MSVKAAKLPPCVTKAEVTRRTGYNLGVVNQLIADGTLQVIKLHIPVRAMILESSLDALVERLNSSLSADTR